MVVEMSWKPVSFECGWFSVTWILGFPWLSSLSLLLFVKRGEWWFHLKSMPGGWHSFQLDEESGRGTGTWQAGSLEMKQRKVPSRAGEAWARRVPAWQGGAAQAGAVWAKLVFQLGLRPSPFHQGHGQILFYSPSPTPPQRWACFDHSGKWCCLHLLESHTFLSSRILDFCVAFDCIYPLSFESPAHKELQLFPIRGGLTMLQFCCLTKLCFERCFLLVIYFPSLHKPKTWEGMIRASEVHEIIRLTAASSLLNNCKILGISFRVSCCYLGKHNNNIMVYSPKSCWVDLKDNEYKMLSIKPKLAVVSHYLKHDGLEEQYSGRAYSVPDPEFGIRDSVLSIPVHRLPVLLELWVEQGRR